MKISNIKPKLIFSFILSISAFLIFVGCSQNIPDITSTNYSVVFSYKDDKSKPDARLCIFLQNKTDVRRCERIRLLSKKADYIWETNNVRKIAAGNYSWAGNVNFVVPEGEKIPRGIYEITYINADEEEDKTSINLYYDEKIYEYTVDELIKNKENEGSMNIAIYDAQGCLIYFGERTEDLHTKGDIFNTFKEAESFQDIWLSYDKTVICILPENKL